MDKKKNNYEITIDEETLISLLGSAGLGLLTMIKEKTLPADTGIWTLAKPLIWEPLTNKELVPVDLIEIFSACDELYVLEEYFPEIFDSEIDKSINKLKKILMDNPEISWNMKITQID